MTERENKDDGEEGSADGEGVEGIRRWTNSGTVEGKKDGGGE
jgi:hypothetical protein